MASLMNCSMCCCVTFVRTPPTYCLIEVGNLQAHDDKCVAQGKIVVVAMRVFDLDVSCQARWAIATVLNSSVSLRVY